MADTSMGRTQLRADNLPLELFVGDTKELDIVIRDMTQWKCCTRCILRFLGEAQPCIYQQPIEILNEWVINHLGSSEDLIATARRLQNESEICIACLGLLQESYNSKEFLNQVERTVKDEDHEISSFSLALSSPVTIILREHSLFIALREKHKSVFYGRGKESISPINVVWKYTHSEDLSKRINATAANAKADSPFEISMIFTHPNVENECNFLFDLFPGTFVRRKHNKYGWEVFARMTVLKALGNVSDNRFQKYYQSPPRQLGELCKLESITCTHDAIFLAGRYNKYSRMLPQSPWIINGERKAESSIEELICDKLRDYIKSKEYKLSAAGREDVDVKMLGNGRPFCVEFSNPHRVNLTKEILLKLQQNINNSTKDIQVSQLQLVDREATNVMKEGETEKTKKYSALCWTEDVITQELLDSKVARDKELVLDQKTPIRVLHRRPLATRQRSIYSMEGKLIDDHHLKLYLSTQAGTYIKEFVHGDFGRTKPSLGTLLNMTCDILELDVEAVELEWPPPVEPENGT